MSRTMIVTRWEKFQDSEFMYGTYLGVDSAQIRVLKKVD